MNAYCASKMAEYGFGRVFEPKSLNMSNVVTEKFQNILGEKWYRIGVNDRENPGTFVYDSNSLPIDFVPNWVSNSSEGPDTTIEKYTCVIVSSRSLDFGVWINIKCTGLGATYTV